MKKTLIIGIATLTLTGTALLASTYAASSSTVSRKTFIDQTHKIDITQTLSGKVSTEALTALQTIITKHQAEMESLRTQTGTTQEQIQAKHESFKTEMDALMTKYPELKTNLPAPRNKGKDGKMEQNPMDTILSNISASDKTTIESIHTEYRTKQETLRTEEKAKIDTIIAKYPELKTKLDAMEKNRPQMSAGRDGHKFREQK